MRKIILLTVFILVANNAYSDVATVARIRNRYPNLAGNPNVTLTALKEIAAELKAGIYVKTSGNNCGGYSCDIICFADGRGFDVFGDWDNRALPQWGSVANLDKNKCQLITVIEPPPPPAPVIDHLANIDANVAEILRILKAAGKLVGVN